MAEENDKQNIPVVGNITFGDSKPVNKRGKIKMVEGDKQEMMCVEEEVIKVEKAEKAEEPKDASEFWEYIDQPIREAVRLLRNNGFNTTCSCGSKMTIEIDLGNHLDEAERMANLLYDKRYKGFKIECILQAPPGGVWIRRAILYLDKWM